MDFSNVVAQVESTEADGDLAAIISADGASPKSVPPIWSEVSYSQKPTIFTFEFFVHPNFKLSQVMRFFTNPHKPMILALSRPDPKKNITTLLKAFGECHPLRDLANLVRTLLQLFTYIHS